MRPELKEKTKNWHVGLEKGTPEFNVRSLHLVHPKLALFDDVPTFACNW